MSSQIEPATAYVAITVDTDGDQYFGKGAPASKGKEIVGWKGFEAGKDLFIEAINRVAESFHISIPITWFVRADKQIAAVHGHSLYLLEQYQTWWRGRRKQGDELQWHAHLYRLGSSGWEQEQESVALAAQIEESLAAMRKAGYFPSVVRIGESFCSNELMAAIFRSGMKADSSALPGRKRFDSEKILDWSTTSNAPYHPSEADYRCAGEKDIDIWEIPMSTVLTRVDYDKAPLLRYVNLAFQPETYFQGFSEYFRRHRVLVSITHPFEIVPSFFIDTASMRHPLLSFNQTSVSSNLTAIIRGAERYGVKLAFVTMSRLTELLEEGLS